MLSRPRHRAKRSLGQNFLVDPNLQKKIVAAIDPGPEDHVLEIGPGQGALTRHLVGRVAHLVVVELDDTLASELQREYEERGDVVVVHGDILDLSFAELDPTELKVIGNIPYGITSPLLFHLLDQHPRPRFAVLTLQRELAQRLAAPPGSKEYGALTVGVRSVADVDLLFPVSRNAFRPRPDVESMAVRITPIRPRPLSDEEETSLRRLTRSAFSRRRKQLQKVLRQAPEYGLSAVAAEAILRRLNIDPTLRPDALPVEGFVRLSRALGAWAG